MADNQQPKDSAQSKKQKPVFIFRMIRIKNSQGVAIVKHRLRLFKGNAVFALVGSGFLGIPGEFHKRFSYIKYIYKVNSCQEIFLGISLLRRISGPGFENPAGVASAASMQRQNAAPCGAPEKENETPSRGGADKPRPAPEFRCRCCVHQRQNAAPCGAAFRLRRKPENGAIPSPRRARGTTPGARLSGTMPNASCR